MFHPKTTKRKSTTNKGTIRAAILRLNFLVLAILPSLPQLNGLVSSSFPKVEKMPTFEPKEPRQRLVLVGGGHAHLQVIKALNKQSRPDNLDVTLIDLQRDASYSGMVPGCVAKLYYHEETQIQLAPLAKWASIDFIQDRVVDVDFDKKQIFLAGDSGTNIVKVFYDVLSFDIGSASRDVSTKPGIKEYAIPTRPITSLVDKIQDAEDKLVQTASQEQQHRSGILVVIVGGGAAGIELALAMKARWGKASFISKQSPLQITILDTGTELLPQESERCKRAMKQLLKEKGVRVRHKAEVSGVTDKNIILTGSSDRIPYTHCIWATGAASHPLSRNLAKNGLAVSDRGWIRVRPTLQSVSHPFVFGAGDCVTIEDLEGKLRSPPKAGVYAVRSGPILIQNLISQLDQFGKPHSSDAKFVKYQPQDDFLKLLNCGDETGIGFRFGIPLQGRWVWLLKDRIDRMFMALFAEENLPQLEESQKSSKRTLDTSQYDALPTDRPARLSVEEAAKIIQRTDDQVDFHQAWFVLRDMANDEIYAARVVQIFEEALFVAQ